MAQTIQIKRNNSNAATKPSSLLVGELAGNLLDRSLYSYDGSNVFQFYTGTDKWFDLLGNANNANKLGGVAASDYLSKTDANKTYQTILGLNNKLSASYISGLATVATSGKYSDLSGTPSSLPASDVYAWAKAATKPSYAFSEITGKPTTLGGYGITDAIGTSGGTIKSAAFSPLAVDRNSDSGAAAIGFTRKSATLGFLGFNDTTGPKWFDSAYTEYPLLHSGNYSSYALPLSGGVLSDSWSGGTEIRRKDSDNGFASLIFSQSDGTILGRFGFGGVNNPLFITQAGGYNTLIHSGNIGSQSVNSLYHKDASMGDYYIKPYIYGYLLEGQFPTLRIRNTNEYNSQIEFADRNNIARWILSYRGLNNADNDLYIYKSDESDAYIPILALDYSSGNVLIGTTTDRGHKLAVTRENGTGTMTASTLHNSALFIGSSDSAYSYGLNLWTEGSGNGFIQQGRTDDYQPRLYNLSLQPFGGNILIGTTDDNGNKLQVNGNITATNIVATNWLYGGADCGMYITNTGVYYSNNSTYANIESSGNEICIGGNADSIYVNYRTPRHYGTAPKVWIWNAGSSDSKADHYIGSLVATGDGVFGSDARYKSKIQDLAVDVETIANAPVFSYKWTDREDDKVHLGTTAQYWMDTNFKDAVDVSNKDFYHLNYGALGVAIGVSLAKKTFDHEERIKALEKENKELKNEIKQLKQWLN